MGIIIIVPKSLFQNVLPTQLISRDKRDAWFLIFCADLQNGDDRWLGIQPRSGWWYFLRDEPLDARMGLNNSARLDEQLLCAVHRAVGAVQLHGWGSGSE